MITPTKGNVVIEEIENPEVSGDMFQRRSGIFVVPEGKKGMKRPQANEGIVIVIGENVCNVSIGQKVWYNRVDTFPFEIEDKKLQIGKAELLLARQL